MPLEIGMTLSTDDRFSNGCFVSTSLEYRFGVEMGCYIVAEFDEHSHSYCDHQIMTTNALEGEISNMDILVGAGWRQPLMGRWSCTALMQAGPTYSHLKDVQILNPDNYALVENGCWIPSIKSTLGLEYQCSSSLNLFFNVGCIRHLKASQLETRYTRSTMIDLSIGFNCPLF